MENFNVIFYIKPWSDSISLQCLPIWGKIWIKFFEILVCTLSICPASLPYFLRKSTQQGGSSVFSGVWPFCLTFPFWTFKISRSSAASSFWANWSIIDVRSDLTTPVSISGSGKVGFSANSGDMTPSPKSRSKKCTLKCR